MNVSRVVFIASAILKPQCSSTYCGASFFIMKTNVVMIRQMGEFQVKQRTVDGFFNATSLLSQWNIEHNQQKQMVHFTDNKSTRQFIDEIMKQELKERDSVLLQTRGKNGGTWMHPLLFIDFAMWINPTFKYHVLKFVYDQLIEFRHYSGDSYKKMCDALYPIVGKEVFARFITEQSLKIKNACKVDNWQQATEQQLKLRDKIHNTAALIADYVNPAKVIDEAILKSLN